MAPMSDEERLIRAAASAWYGDQPNEIGVQFAKNNIDMLRKAGITLTPPPAPEPTYTRTFTETQWGFLIGALDKHPEGSPRMPDGRLLVSHMDEQKPDPEPGA